VLTYKETEMTAPEIERITKLETIVKTLVDEVRQGRKDIETLQKTIDQLTGGKQALIYITGVALTVAGLILAFLNFNKHN
jgi:cystathionine beta-lyase/cystathionine gamma-synthase